MTAKTLISMAVIAALPITAMAENISGVMYTAPIAADTNHPAPTTDADPSYGRVNIDTIDQEHIATTAYVKGAYNSAIAAVNKVADNMDGKQDQLVSPDGPVSSTLMEADGLVAVLNQHEANFVLPEVVADVQAYVLDGEVGIMSARAVAEVVGALRVPIFTEWGNDGPIGAAFEMVPLNGIPGITYNY